jgi:hypothetical protein
MVQIKCDSAATVCFGFTGVVVVVVMRIEFGPLGTDWFCLVALF